MNGVEKTEFGEEDERRLLVEDEESVKTEKAEEAGVETDVEDTKKEETRSEASGSEEVNHEKQGGESSTANLLKGKRVEIENLTDTENLLKGDGRAGRMLEGHVEEAVVEFLEKGPLEMSLKQAEIVEEKIKAMLHMEYGRKEISKERYKLWCQLGAFMSGVKKGNNEWLVAVEWEVKTKDERFKEMINNWLNPGKNVSDKEYIGYDRFRKIEIKSYKVPSKFVLNMRRSLRGEGRVYEEPEGGLARIYGISMEEERKSNLFKEERREEFKRLKIESERRGREARQRRDEDRRREGERRSRVWQTRNEERRRQEEETRRKDAERKRYKACEVQQREEDSRVMSLEEERWGWEREDSIRRAKVAVRKEGRRKNERMEQQLQMREETKKKQEVERRAREEKRRRDEEELEGEKQRERLGARKQDERAREQRRLEVKKQQRAEIANRERVRTLTPLQEKIDMVQVKDEEGGVNLLELVDWERFKGEFLEKEVPAERPLFIGDERKGKWQRRDQDFEAGAIPARVIEETKENFNRIVKEELNVKVRTVEMYLRVLRRVAVKVEILGREISFASRDEDEFMEQKMGWRRGMSVRQKRLVIGYYVKGRAAEFVREVDNLVEVFEEYLGDEELTAEEGLKFIDVETGVLLRRLWWSWNLEKGVNKEDFELKGAAMSW